jgi:hypothetical protein
MASTVRIDVNRRTIRELLRGEEIQRELKARAEKIAQAAGPGHKVDTKVGPNRAHARVSTDTFPARYHEATGRTLTRALDAGR